MCFAEVLKKLDPDAVQGGPSLRVWHVDHWGGKDQLRLFHIHHDEKKLTSQSKKILRKIIAKVKSKSKN